MGRFENLTGKKINHLLILERDFDKKHKGHTGCFWKCKCDCGVIKTIRADAIKSGRNKSCGCKKNQTRKQQRYNWKGCGEIHGKYFSRIKDGAIERDLNFNITIEDIWEIFLAQNRKCAITKQKIYFGNTHKDETTASLDRIDNNRGYEIDNIQWVHKTINIMKSDMSMQEFIDICGSVTNNQTYNDDGY